MKTPFFTPFLHLEGGESLIAEDVVGIFDMDQATGEEATREFLKESQKQMQVVSLASDLPRSFVLVREVYNDRVYISGLSTETVVKRSNSLSD
ncbi:MAG: DUF370 domain-containing protein [Clostridia bacterium]|nr:DUF370 domain-containing protein [Clostridia bacterium]